MSDILPPFSVRNRRGVLPLDEEFPPSGRVGLVHLVNSAIEQDFIENWSSVAAELQRIARLPPSGGGDVTATNILNQLSWERVFDFCERMYGHLAQAGQVVLRGNIVRHSKSEAQEFLSDELQRLFQ